MQECYTLPTGAGIVDSEGTIRHAVGNAVLQRPCHSVIAVATGNHICGNRSRALGRGRTGGTPQERDNLPTGARIVGTEEAIGLTVGDAPVHGPFHSLGIVGIGGNIRKGGHLGFHELSGNSDFGCRHGEGVLAIALVDQLHSIAAGVLHGNGVQLVALVRGDGDGHAVALGGVLGRNGHIAVLRAGDGHGVTAAGRAGGGTAAGRPLRSRYAQYLRVAASNRVDSRNPQRVRGIGTQACQRHAASRCVSRLLLDQPVALIEAHRHGFCRRAIVFICRCVPAQGNRAGSSCSGYSWRIGCLQLRRAAAQQIVRRYRNLERMQLFRRHAGDLCTLGTVAPRILIRRICKPVLQFSPQGIGAVCCLGQHNDEIALHFLHSRQRQVLIFQVVPGRLQLLQRGFLGREDLLGATQGRLECLPVVGGTVGAFFQLLRLRDQPVQFQQRLEHIMFLRNVAHQFMEFHIPVVGRDHSLVVDPQTVRLHGVQEFIQQSLRKIAQQHELRIRHRAGVLLAGSFIAIQPGQMAHCLIQLLRSDGFRRDIQFRQNRPHPDASGGVLPQVVEHHLRVGHRLVFAYNGNRRGQIIHFLAFPFRVGQAQLDNQPVTGVQFRAVLNGNGQFRTPGSIAVVGVDLPHPLGQSQIFPQFLAFKLRVAVAAGELIDGYIAVEVRSHGNVFIRVVNLHTDALGIGFHRRHIECGIGRSPIGRRLHGQDIRPGFHAVGGQYDL